MSILLLSLGGGAGNILRSVKRLFGEDVAICKQADEAYADRLSRSVATRFVDTNRFSLTDIPADERLLIGADTTHHLGSRHDPEVARRALEESRVEIEELIARHSAVIVIATGGKGTGAGTIVPITMMARQQKKLVIPIFVRPSFERHEVEKRRYDHALRISHQLDAAQIRFVEILNDRGYVDADPQPQSVVWDRMNVPIARALRGLLYVLWDLSQVDPSDLSALFAGHGRLRIGFAEIDPQPGSDPSDQQLDDAVMQCWDDGFCNFNGPVGTSLICIHGQWSNIVDAKIKSRLAARAAGAESSPYNPLYARASQLPKPWGVTTMFTEYTGEHAHPDISFTDEQELERAAPSEPQRREPVTARRSEGPPVVPAAKAVPAYRTFWELALGLNRSDPVAVALAQDGAESDLTIDVAEVRKLLDTFWFRSAFPRLSAAWKERLLHALVENVTVPNHVLKIGRQEVRLREATHSQLLDLFSRASVSDAVRADMRLLIAVGNLWGPEGLARCRFTHDSPAVDRERVRHSSAEFAGN